MSGVLVSGLDNSSFGFRAALDSQEFTVKGLHVDESRLMLFYHRQRRLAAKVLISADETEPLAIRLQPCGIASGRVVDRSGVPVADVSIEFCPKVPEIHVGSGTWIAQSDDSGRFEISSLIDGMDTRYSQRVAIACFGR